MLAVMSEREEKRVKSQFETTFLNVSAEKKQESLCPLEEGKFNSIQFRPVRHLTKIYDA
jgi:hypothetical protein